ncbi:MAG: esterase-like activity of phytase family protein [Sphingomicrobium sp.]
MRRILGLNFLLAATLTTPASASIVYLANGQLSGTSDLSGLTAPLENGLPGNILGGLGSGLTYAGGNQFLATPDRGPNATAYNSAVDDTTSYISRFQTLTLALTATPGAARPFALDASLNATTLLSSPTALTYGSGAGLGFQIDGVTPLGSGAPASNSAGQYYFSGRSDNFGAGNSGVVTNARFDPEAIRVSNDGLSVFISDEYGPYVRQFDRATGSLIKTFTLPTNLDVANLSPNGATEISGNTIGRVANKGMEGLAITPDGKTLVGIMQAALEQDAAVAASAKLLRIVTIDIATGATREYGYKLTSGTGVSEIVAINDHEFLVDERDGKGLGDGTSAVVKQIFKIDISGATDITGLSGAAAAAATGVVKSGTPFLNLVAALTAAGVPASQIPAKIEGMTFGQDVAYDGAFYHTLFIANDNDFVPGVAGGNQFYVFGFQDGDLAGFVPQKIGAVPEPATWAMMLLGFAIAGGTLRRRRKPLSQLA